MYLDLSQFAVREILANLLLLNLSLGIKHALIYACLLNPTAVYKRASQGRKQSRSLHCPSDGTVPEMVQDRHVVITVHRLLFTITFPMTLNDLEGHSATASFQEQFVEHFCSI